jgi:hypothetical protein
MTLSENLSRLAAITAATAAAALLAPGPIAAAQPAEAPPGTEVEPRAHERGVLLRIGGDVEVLPGEQVDAVIAIDGDARVAGTADSVMVIDGTAELDGAQVREVVVVGGHARLLGATTVAEDVVLVGSTVERAPSVTVGGQVRTERPWHGVGFWISGVLLGLGVLLALVLAGLAIAAVVPHGVRRAGRALTHDVVRTLGASLLVWIVVPIVLIASFATVLTIPVGIGFLVFLLPAIGLFGYIVAGIRLGDALLGAIRNRVEAAHPYLAAVIGIPLLALISLVPGIGALVTVLAGFLGAGAILVAFWRTARARPELPRATALGTSPIAGA